MEKKITASIVLYNTNSEELRRTVASIFNTVQNIQLYLIDNSPSDDLKFFKDLDDNIEYIHNPKNPGFGAAHNVAIGKALLTGSSYHFIVNPDIYFTGDIITPMISYLQNNPSVGMLMPQILNTDGTIQNLPKLLPTPLSIVWRKVKKPNMSYQKFIDRYELRNVPENVIFNAPILSGCFTLLNLKAIQEIGLYDDAYFMYFEDWDLSRRMHQKYQTIYFPLVSVYHGYDSGANKNKDLFKIFIASAITYFNKWGWFFDAEREKINTATISQFK